MTPTRRLLTLAVAAALLTASTRAGDELKVPAFDQFLVVPLRVHVLNSPEFAMTACKITDAEITKSLTAVNAIWSKAGLTKQAAAAVKARDTARARRLDPWLAAIPGTGAGAGEAKKALAALPADKAK